MNSLSRRPSRLLMFAVIVVAACVAALTASGAGKAAAATRKATAASASSSKAAKGAPIKIGMLGSFQSEVSQQAAGLLPEEAQAWVSYTNAHGGVNGHPVKLTVIDDHDDPAQAIAGAKQLIADHVVAITPEFSLQDGAFAKILQASGIPAIGGDSDNVAQYSNPDFFPVGSSVPDTVYGMLKQSLAEGKTKFGVLYCAEAPSCSGIAGLTAGLLKVIGSGSMVYSSSIAAAAPNYTAQCLAAKGAGVDVVWLGDSAPINQRVVQDCAQQGYHPLIATCCSGSIGGIVNSWAPTGSVFSEGSIPPEDSSAAGIRLMDKILAKYAPKLTPSNPQYSEFYPEIIAGLQLFKAAAEKAGVGPHSTPATLKKGLYALTGDTLGGLTAPIAFKKGKPTDYHDYFLETVKNGGTVVPLKNKVQVIPASQVAGVVKLGG